MPAPTYPPQSLWRVARDILGTAVCYAGARLMTPEAKAVLVAKLRAR